MKDASTQPITETIIPLGTPKKNNGTDRENFKFRYRFKVLALVCAFILLIGGGGWLLHFLSKKSFQSAETENSELQSEPIKAENIIESPQKPPPEVAPAQLAVDKTNAEQKLAQYLAVKDELDQKAVPLWGGELYLRMTELGRQADARFMDNQYNLAADLYESTSTLAGELSGQADTVLQRLLTEGSQALDDGDGTLAQQKFSVALKIAPADAVAQQGLKRAETIETVMQLVESGRQHEINNELSLARAEYSKALKIDSKYKKAREGLDRINALIKEEQFQELLSVGLAAFHRKEYKFARARLLKAKSLKPESREVSDALLQVDQAIRLSAIDKLRLAAQKAEGSEDWQNALKSYLAVLDIDKNLQFAIRGKERALEQVQIAKRVSFFLANPQVLESDSQLRNAGLLLAQAAEITPRGPLLTTRINELEDLVVIAQTPVKIAIESDNLTRVAVYRVGKLGRFSVHELELRPGTYTVVGTRDGYQDVRQKIVVKSGLQSVRITVKCKVRI